MPPTLVILNVNAASGKARTLWPQLEPILRDGFGELRLVETDDAEDVPPAVQQAAADGVRRVIAIGGDGTNHSAVNALCRLPSPNGTPMVFGSVPVGTGRDWSRSLGTPLEPIAAAHALKQAAPRPVDVMGLRLDDNPPRYVLNVASTGLGGEVDRRVNATEQRRPWTFLWATVQAIWQYVPQAVQVRVDGADWYDGRAFLVVVANGGTFGHGMQIAPGAQVDDGVLDVLLIRGVHKAQILLALRRVYNGSHLTHPAVMHTRAQTIRIVCASPLPLDLDGEYASAHRLSFTAEAGALHVLA